MQIDAKGFNGAPAISPRGGPAHGVYGDHWAVFGGFTPSASGPPTTASDLWFLEIPTGTWFQMPPPSPAPVVQQGTFAAGVFIGRHFYILLNSAVTGVNELWRWSIVPGQYGPPPSGGGGSSNSGVATAHSWGIAIGCLIGLAQLALFVKVALAQGWLSGGCGLPSFGGGGAKYTAASVSSTVGSGYVAPTADYVQA